ncbi:hypothetical protein QYE76_031136 [Lolium multiflorum]|uniref:Uncharacterized protein n=1 Tax=Lolium multiflorum TaxID=4521 RepID=A0AAD8QR25_LOLMU|nr:hypothetical protein QYE76_031136 [Lolium multiflorum]
MGSGAVPVSCKWVKPQGPAKGFDFDISKAEQIFDLLLKEKQLKLPEGHKIPTAQEMNGRPYCKWHHSFTHVTNDCKELRRQIQLAIEQGRLIFSQFAMKVDTQPFPSVNMVELDHPVQRRPGFSFGINMAGHVHHRCNDKEEPVTRGKEKRSQPRDRDVMKRYLTKEQTTENLVGMIETMKVMNAALMGGQENKKTWTIRDCPFFEHCWDSGMRRLPVDSQVDSGQRTKTSRCSGV